MDLFVKLAWRSIWRNRRRTIITLSSIAFGLMLAVFFIAIGDGFYAKMVDDAVRMSGGHVSIEHPGYRDAPAVDLAVGGVEAIRERIEGLPHVERTKILVLGQGVAKSGLGAVGIAVVGLEPAQEAGSNPVSKRLIVGKYLEEEDEDRVLVGSELAKHLKLGKRAEAEKLAAFMTPLLGTCGVEGDRMVEELLLYTSLDKKIVISSTNVKGEVVEELLRVKGIFRIGSPEIDGYFIQVPIGFARRLFGLRNDEATQLGVVIRDPMAQETVLEEIRGLLRDQQARVLPWEQVMPDLSSYIDIDRGSNLIFQGIILFLIMFTIFNTILMSVLERKREFAVALALGTPPRWLSTQVLLETAFIGLLGCGLGLVLGGLTAFAFQVHGLDISNMLSEGTSVSGVAIDAVVHPQVTFGMLAWLGGLVFGATMLLSVYPMRQAVRTRIADLLR